MEISVCRKHRRQQSAPSRLLKFYSSYRLFLSALLLWLGHLDSSPIYFDDSNSGLFSITAAVYLARQPDQSATVPTIALEAQRNSALCMLLVDVVAINLMLLQLRRYGRIHGLSANGYCGRIRHFPEDQTSAVHCCDCQFYPGLDSHVGISSQRRRTSGSRAQWLSSVFCCLPLQ